LDLTFASGARGWVGSECQIRSTSIGPALCRHRASVERFPPMVRAAQSASLAKLSMADRQACEDQHPDALEQCDKRAKRRVVRGSTTAQAFRLRTMLWRTWIATSASPPRTATRACETHHPCGLLRTPNPGPARNCVSHPGALSPPLRAISRRSSSLMLAKPRSGLSFPAIVHSCPSSFGSQPFRGVVRRTVCLEDRSERCGGIAQQHGIHPEAT
jgi:hypothetical protein